VEPTLASDGVGPTSRHRRPGAGPTSRRRRPGVVAALALLTFVVYSTYSVSRFRQYLPAGYDLGIFDQVVRKYSEFKAPIVSLKGPHYNIFGDHFHPILAALAPLYWVWQDPRMLLLAQSALIAASVPIVHRFAARYLSARQSLVLTLAYCLGWPLQAMADFDFHEIAFGVPLIAWAIDSLDRREDRGLFIASALLLLTREDMGMLVLVLGFLRLVRRPRTPAAVRAGAGLMIAGVAMYLFTTKVALPHFANDGQFAYWSYDALGKNPVSALVSIIVHPWHAIWVFFTPITKTRTLLYLIGPLALLPLRSRYFLIALPVFAGRFFSSRDHLWSTEFHYSSILWPILVLAAVDAAHRFWLPVFARRWRAGLTWFVIGLVLVTNVVGTATDSTLYPLRRLFTLTAFPIGPHTIAQAGAVALIPKDTCVEADDRIAVHLTRANVVTVPSLLGRAPDFTILDMHQSETGYQMPTPKRALATAQARGDQQIYESDGILVLRSATYTGPSAACRP
jgi:uncharacterized membrane protein